MFSNFQNFTISSSLLFFSSSLWIHASQKEWICWIVMWFSRGSKIRCMCSFYYLKLSIRHLLFQEFWWKLNNRESRGWSCFKKNEWSPPPKVLFSSLTAGENINPDFESKSGGKTRFWDKEHSGHGAPHWTPGETYPKISEAVGLFREAHLVKQT